MAKGQAGAMRQHSLSVESVASSHRQGQPHPSLSKGFCVYQIPLASIPRRRISVYFLPPRPKPIYRLPIDGYGKGTSWSHAATFIVGRKRCSSPRQGQPHPSLSKGFRAYRISFANIPCRRISVYLLPPRPNPIHRLPIGGYDKGTSWSHAATFIVGRKRCVFSSPRTAPSLPFQRLSCLSNPFCQHSP